MFEITQTMKDTFFEKMVSKKNPNKLSPKAHLHVTDEIRDFMALYNIESIQDFGFIMLNKLTDFPKCAYCGKNITKKLYMKNKCCSHSCGAYMAQDKKKQTCIERYGVEHYSSTEAFKEANRKSYTSKTDEEKQAIKNKRTDTMISRFGVENPLQSPEIHKRKKMTCLKKYGSENYFQTKDYREKNTNTCLERYGTEFYTQTEEFKSKIKETCKEKYGTEFYSQTKEFLENRKSHTLEKYGVEFYSQTEAWKNKVSQTCKEKYGVENYFQTEEFLENRKLHTMEKYGVENYFQTEEFLSHRREQNYQSFLDVLSTKGLKMLSSYEEYISFKEDLVFECLCCGYTFTNNAYAPSAMICKECAKKPYSKKEKEIVSWITETYSYDVIENDKSVLSGKELDIYIPDMKVAIEFDGSYWHSDTYIDANYHLWKTEQCRNQGIRLIHIFEWEWDNKQDICKSIIASALRKSKRRIYARNCVVQELEQNVYGEFLSTNHLQDSLISPIRYGLFHNEDLVCVIGFGNCETDNTKVVLQRFCCATNTQVIGGLSKLIKHSNIGCFVADVDLAHFNGDGYFACGLIPVSQSKPNFVYVRGAIVKEQNSDLFDEGLNAGAWYKVYDCGTITLEYKS